MKITAEKFKELACGNAAKIAESMIKEIDNKIDEFIENKDLNLKFRLTYELKDYNNIERDVIRNIIYKDVKNSGYQIYFDYQIREEFISFEIRLD